MSARVMARWKSYFSGASLNQTSYLDKIHNKWWERMANDFLLSFADVPFAVVVTIGNHSSSVMFNIDEQWQVFVPYGNIEFLGHNIENASCCVFETVDAAVAFLMKAQSGNGHCHVAFPHIIRRTSVYEDDVDIDNRHETFKAKKSSVCPDKSRNTDNEEDKDPFISMMGGFEDC